MTFKSGIISLAILGVTAVIFSRTVFFAIADPEGPNLLVVLATAAIVFLLSLAAYLFSPPVWLIGLRRLLAAIVLQLAIVAGLYFWMK